MLAIFRRYILVSLAQQLGTFQKEKVTLGFNRSTSAILTQSKDGVLEESGGIFSPAIDVDFDNINTRSIQSVYRFHIPVWPFNLVFTNIGLFACHYSIDPKKVTQRGSVPGIKFSLHKPIEYLFFLVSYFKSLIHGKNYVKRTFLNLEGIINKNIDDYFWQNAQQHYLNSSSFVRNDVLQKQASLAAHSKFLFDVRRLVAMLLDQRIHRPIFQGNHNVTISEEFSWIQDQFSNNVDQKTINQLSNALLALELMMDNNKTLVTPGLSNFDASALFEWKYAGVNYKFLKYSTFEKCKDITTRVVNPGKIVEYPVCLYYEDESYNEIVRVKIPSSQVNLAKNFWLADRYSTVFTSHNLITDSCQENLSILMYEANHPLIHKTFINGAICKFDEHLTIINDGTLCSTGSPSNFYTWMIEILPRIFTAEKEKLCPPYMVVGNETSWHRETLKLLDLSDEVLFLKPEKQYQFNNTHIVKSSEKEVPNLDNLRSFALTLKSKVALNQQKMKKIYVSRRKYFSGRYLINELELEKYFKDIGFHILYPEEHTVCRQIELFASAEVIVGPTGAWASNLMFCNKRCKAYIITPIDNLATFFPHIFSISGGSFTWLASRPLRTKLDERIHADHYLPISTIEDIRF